MINSNRFDLILADVWEEVQDLKSGVLYRTIFILAPNNARDICQIFEIKESAHLNEDIQTLDRIKIFQDVLNIFDPFRVRHHQIIYGSLTNIAGMNSITVKIIIGIGLTFIALYSLSRYQNQSNQRSSPRKPPVTHSPTSDAVLCLIVPTNRIDSEFRNILFPENELRRETTKLLLDKSVYFITCTEGNLDNYIGGLNLSQAQINYDDGGEIYIELLLPEGEDTIGQDMQRIISRNLPDVAIIKRVYQLNNLSNIERFHRA